MWYKMSSKMANPNSKTKGRVYILLTSSQKKTFLGESLFSPCYFDHKAVTLCIRDSIQQSLIDILVTKTLCELSHIASSVHITQTLVHMETGVWANGQIQTTLFTTNCRLLTACDQEASLFCSYFLVLHKIHLTMFI